MIDVVAKFRARSGSRDQPTERETAIAWAPQAKQWQFMCRPEYEALFGGAAGGGKSDAIVAEALRQVDIPHYKALILRKTFPQLRELIDKSMRIYPRAYPRARYNAAEHFWTFPSGAKIYFGSMQHDADKLQYQGQAYDYIAFDELTHFTWDEYSYMFSRNRPSGEGTRVYIRASTNPGGVGGAWVKQRFIDAGPAMTPIREKQNIIYPDGSVRELERDRIFVPATVFDNTILLRNDPNYLANLAMLPEAERNALLYGDWTSFEGQVFREWKDDPRHYDDHRFTHVIEPFPIPEDWRIYRGFDFGFSKPFSVGWYTVDPGGTMYRFAEYYGCKSDQNHNTIPNTGSETPMEEVARNILRFEAEHPAIRGRRDVIGIADPSIFDESRGLSIAEIMAREHVFWDKGDNTRIAGKMQFHYRLAFDEEGKARFYVFRNCRNFIRTIPQLVYSERHIEDVDTSLEDHIYDETRYVMMASPVTPRRNILDKDTAPANNDPLFLNKRTDEKYKFYRV